MCAILHVRWCMHVAMAPSTGVCESLKALHTRCRAPSCCASLDQLRLQQRPMRERERGEIEGGRERERDGRGREGGREERERRLIIQTSWACVPWRKISTTSVKKRGKRKKTTPFLLVLTLLGRKPGALISLLGSLFSPSRRVIATSGCGISPQIPHPGHVGKLRRPKRTR